MINLDDTTALNRIAFALERIAGAAELIAHLENKALTSFFGALSDSEKNTREQSNEKGNSNDNTETAEEV